MAEIINGIVTLGEHKWQLPQKPKQKKDILFSDKKKEDQYWRRLKYPTLVDQYKRGITEEYAAKTRLSEDKKIALSISVEDTEMLIKFQEEELRRRWEGIWFMNNGEPTYLTGSHYFMLQWVQMFGYTNPLTGDSYGQYREFQRDVFYFIQMVNEDKKCSGGFIGKPKKTGITQLFASYILDLSLRYKEKEFGMMSESQKKCMETNLKYYLHGYDHVPDIISHPFETRNKTEIKLAYPTPTGTTKESLLKKISSNDSLKNHVFAAPTKLNAFDAPVMFVVWLDEFPKYIDPWPGPVFDASKETVKITGRRHGRMWLTSYVPEKDGENFEQAKKVWDDSALSTKDEVLGETKSGLYRYFISADESYEDDGFEFDRYGRVDRKKVITYIEAKRRQLEEKYSDLQAFKRQYPRHEKEMWTTAGGHDSVFDSVRLVRRINELNENMSGQPQFEYGHLEWVDKSRRLGRGYGQGEFGLVEWVPLPVEDIKAGKTDLMKWYNKDKYPPLTYNQVIAKNIRDFKTGLLTPGDTVLNVIGGDPTEYTEDVRVEDGSKDAFIVTTMPDSRIDGWAGGRISGMPYLQYLGRPDNPEDVVDDVIKLLLFTGGLAYIEGNKAWLLTRLLTEGLGHFVVMRNKNTKMLERWDPKKDKEQVYPTTLRTGGMNTIQDLVVCLKRRLRKPDSADDGIDMIASLKLLDLLNQLLNFNPIDTKKSDLVMAWGFAEMLVDSIIGWNMGKTKRTDKNQMRKLFAGLTGGRLQ